MRVKVSELKVNDIFKFEYELMTECTVIVTKLETPRTLWGRVLESSTDAMKVGHYIFFVFHNAEETVERIYG